MIIIINISSALFLNCLRLVRQILLECRILGLEASVLALESNFLLFWWFDHGFIVLDLGGKSLLVPRGWTSWTIALSKHTFHWFILLRNLCFQILILNSETISLLPQLRDLNTGSARSTHLPIISSLEVLNFSHELLLHVVCLLSLNLSRLGWPIVTRGRLRERVVLGHKSRVELPGLAAWFATGVC